MSKLGTTARHPRRWGLLLLTVLGFATLAAPASAAPNPYTPREVCGSNYRIIDRERHRDEGIHLGTTFLMWNGATKRNCVVTGSGGPRPCQARPGLRQATRRAFQTDPLVSSE